MDIPQLVDSPGIEPGIYPCEGYGMPFTYEPTIFSLLQIPQGVLDGSVFADLKMKMDA